MPDTGQNVSSAQDFEALVADVYVPLQRYLRRRTDGDTAGDVLADTLLVMWRRFDDIPADAALPWCYGVARRCLANTARQSERRMQLLKRLAAEAPRSEPSSDPALDEALAQLNARDQELLRLWAWESLTAAEIALALGISPNAASIRLHRAIKKLKKQLTERKEPPGSGQQLERQGEQSW